MNPEASFDIYEWMKNLVKEEKEVNVNRCSAATYCVRRRWYANHGFKGEAVTPRLALNFKFGHLVEMFMTSIIRESLLGVFYSEINFGERVDEIPLQGMKLTNYEQQTLSFKINDLLITGHADGFGKRVRDGMWELIEIKSAATFGYSDFVRNGPGDYIKQAHAVMLTDECRKLGVNTVRYFYLKKDTTEIFDKAYQFCEETAELVKNEFINATSEIIPEDPYGFKVDKKGNKTIGFPCTYCPYIKECKGEYKIERTTSGKKQYLFKEGIE